MSFPKLKKSPLDGLRVLITRPQGQAGELSTLLAAQGATVLQIPTIRIAPPASYGPLDAAIRRLDSFDWLLLTSANGSRVFFERLRKAGKRPSGLRPRIGVVGPKTREAVEKEGGTVALTAQEHRGEGLADDLGDVTERKILLVRAGKARDVLPRTLEKRGASVTIASAYRTLPAVGARAALKRLARWGEADLVLFTSASTAESMRLLLGPRGFRRFFDGALAASIGPITTAALRSFGVEPSVEARVATARGLVEAIRQGARHV